MHLSGCSYHVACVCVQRQAGALQRVFLPFGSAKRVHFSGCSYCLACVCAVLSGCTSAGVLTIWHACVQRKAGAPQRVCAAQSGCTSAGVLTIWQRKAGAFQWVFLPCGTRVCSAERMHLSGCSYHLACVCAVLSGCTSAGVLTIWHACVRRKAGAPQRVCAAQSGCTSAGVLTIWRRKAGAFQWGFLPCGMRVCSAERMHLSGCSYHLACVCAVLSGCTSAGVLTIWHACVQRKAGALQRVFLPFGTRVC